MAVTRGGEERGRCGRMAASPANSFGVGVQLGEAVKVVSTAGREVAGVGGIRRRPRARTTARSHERRERIRARVGGGEREAASWGCPPSRLDHREGGARSGSTAA